MGKLTRFLDDMRGWRARVTRVRGVVIEVQLGANSLRASTCLENLIQIHFFLDEIDTFHAHIPVI